jgi:hypothetical protein
LASKTDEELVKHVAVSLGKGSALHIPYLSYFRWRIDAQRKVFFLWKDFSSALPPTPGYRDDISRSMLGTHIAGSCLKKRGTGVCQRARQRCGSSINAGFAHR